MIEHLKNRQLLFSDISTIWENNDGCAEQYIHETELYLLSMLEQAYNIMINQGVGSPGHRREDVDGINSKRKKVSTNVNDKCETYRCCRL